jgi:hypothetical protein
MVGAGFLSFVCVGTIGGGFFSFDGSDGILPPPLAFDGTDGASFDPPALSCPLVVVALAAPLVAVADAAAAEAVAAALSAVGVLGVSLLSELSSADGCFVSLRTVNNFFILDEKLFRLCSL